MDPLSKFKVLELIARVPYQAWEQVAYVAMTHTSRSGLRAADLRPGPGEPAAAGQRAVTSPDPGAAHRPRGARGLREGLASAAARRVFYYQIVWLPPVVRPKWAYRPNAGCEDHAKHEYMEFVREHPEPAQNRFESIVSEDYGRFESLGDVIRQIGYDERVRAEESLNGLAAPRVA